MGLQGRVWLVRPRREPAPMRQELWGPQGSRSQVVHICTQLWGLPFRGPTIRAESAALGSRTVVPSHSLYGCEGSDNYSALHVREEEDRLRLPWRRRLTSGDTRGLWTLHHQRPGLLSEPLPRISLRGVDRASGFAGIECGCLLVAGSSETQAGSSGPPTPSVSGWESGSSHSRPRAVLRRRLSAADSRGRTPP